jgi:activator of HSP90 ATPase
VRSPLDCQPLALLLSCRTERDASNWSTEKLKTLFLAVRVENEEGKCEVTEVNKLDGEASINNRKGKLIFFYEWTIKLNWTGKACQAAREEVIAPLP